MNEHSNENTVTLIAVLSIIIGIFLQIFFKLPLIVTAYYLFYWVSLQALSFLIVFVLYNEKITNLTCEYQNKSIE